MTPRQLHRRAHELFPHNPGLAHKWVRAKLHLGHRRPTVSIGTRLNEFRPLAPRSMKEAALG